MRLFELIISWESEAFSASRSKVTCTETAAVMEDLIEQLIEGLNGETLAAALIKVRHRQSFDEGEQKYGHYS